MKNWRFVQTGNKDTPELREKLRDLNEQIKNWEHAKGIDGVEKANAQKTLDELRKERSEVQKEIATDNESIGKQEWSMFKGLAKDAEKEVGNASESDSIRNEYNAEIHRLEKKMEQLYRMGQGKSAMAIEKQIAQLQKELRELGNKKTGNELPNDAEVKYDGYIIRYYPYQGKYIVTHPTDFSKTNAFIGKKFSTSEEAIKAIQKRGVGNEETKADKKFGTVMGEFKEGTLKSSSGETVTDPEQAKAIAYSESEKVDNLKRARNSIKK